MGASFPKPECTPNCIERVGLTCEERFLKRPTGNKQVRVEVQCQEECKNINEFMRISLVTDAFVSSLAEGNCGGPRGSGKKAGFYSVEIRGTNTGSIGSGNDDGTKAPKLDQRFALVEGMLQGTERMRDYRTWYQSFSDLLMGPSEPSRQKVDEFKSLLDDAKARRAMGDREGASGALDHAIKTGRMAVDEYDTYLRTSLNHADLIKWLHLGVGALLFVGGSAVAITATLGGSVAVATASTEASQVISLLARSGGSQVIQETLKRAALILFGLKAAEEGEGSDR